MLIRHNLFNDDLLNLFYGTSTLKPYINVDVSNESERYLLEAELSGISIEDVEIKVEGTTLTLKGEKKYNKKNYLVNERTSGTFSRSFSLPTDVDSEAISATYKDGILSVSIAKKKKKIPKQIKINVSS